MDRYYDYVLGLIPTALIGVTVLLSTVGVSWHTAVPAGAAIAIGVMAHAMFVRAPRPASAAAVADAAASASGAVRADAVRADGGGADAVGAGATRSAAIRPDADRSGSRSGPESEGGRADSGSEHPGPGPGRRGSAGSAAGGD